MKRFIPVILKLVGKLMADKNFKDLVFKIAVIEGQWLSGQKKPEVALEEIVKLLKDYFGLEDFVVGLA